MHPRTIIRRKIAETLSDIGVEVYPSRARDLRKGEDEAIIVYISDETLSRPRGGGEMRVARPVQRDMSVEILIMTTTPGDGSEAAERGDELSRQVELRLNDQIADLHPVSATQAHAEGAQIKCLTSLIYQTTYHDNMEAQ
jgi:hypothetical protein